MVVRERSGAVLLATSSFLCGVREWLLYYVECAVALLSLRTSGRCVCELYHGFVLCRVLVLQSIARVNLDVCLGAESFGTIGAWRLHSHWELSVHCVAFMVGARSLQCVCPGVCCGWEALLLVAGGVVHSAYGQYGLAARMGDGSFEHCQYARWFLC